MIDLENIVIRKLNKNDISEIALARKYQEKEAGNKVTVEYLDAYKKIILRLFSENLLIGVGAFAGEKLISVAYFNLLNYGSISRVPYLCGVWTELNYRRKGISSKVNFELMQEVCDISPSNYFLLTVEGGEAAYKLYKKLGYQRLDYEMSFLGDVYSLNNGSFKTSEYKNNNVNTIIFYRNNKTDLQIDYSIEQLFSHPQNINGILARILQIKVLNDGLDKLYFQQYLQYLFSKYRFCKFNLKELVTKDNNKILKMFNLHKIDDLMKELEELTFLGMDNKKYHIKRNTNVLMLLRDDWKF